MKSYLSILLAVLLAMPLLAITEEGPQIFEYRRTVAIYHLMNGGGIIYVQPSEYDENQGFIRISQSGLPC